MKSSLEFVSINLHHKSTVPSLRASPLPSRVIGFSPWVDKCNWLVVQHLAPHTPGSPCAPLLGSSCPLPWGCLCALSWVLCMPNLWSLSPLLLPPQRTQNPVSTWYKWLNQTHQLSEIWLAQINLACSIFIQFNSLCFSGIQLPFYL